MALPPSRILSRGHTDYKWERDALDFVYRELASSSSCLAWELVELHDPSTGGLYEIDLLILGHSALYLVEIKSGPGLYKGDSVDWHREYAGRVYPMDCPYPLANRKAKKLAGMLSRKMDRPPFVQAMIFLSHEDTKLDLRADGLTAVVTRKNVIRAITHGELPNLDARRHAVAAPSVHALQHALKDIGVRERKTRLIAGGCNLGALIEEGPGYQDREAEHAKTKGLKYRARTYLVPQQTSVERRQSLLRAASREAQLLHELREHAGILRINHFDEDAGVGPTVLFDAFEDSARLDAFLKSEPKLAFDQRIDLITRIGRALAYCHRKSVLHGALNPEAVLVKRGDDGALDARIFNFQLGSLGDRIEPTMHASALTAQPWLVYQAPELRADPTERRVQADIFSLGALAYFVLTGQAPALDVGALDARLAKSNKLDPRAVDDTIPPGVADLVSNATDANWANRFDDANEWVQFLLDAATAPAEVANEERLVDPLDATKGDLVAPDLRVESVLGQGATARVLRVLRTSDEMEYALKVSLAEDHDARIRAESGELAALRHPRIVQKIEDRKIGDRAAILMTLAGTRTLQKELADKGPVSLEYALRWGEDLLEAVEYLESIDKLHRDIKPANVGVGTTSKKALRLTLFDFSLVLVGEDDRQVGTAVYRDPFLPDRERWDAAADRWSAAVTLHEMLTGARPKGPTRAEPNVPLVLAAERFDAQIRDRLVTFFTKALAMKADARFASAEDMKRAWSACFATSHHPVVDEEEAWPQEAFDDEAIAQIPPETLVEALPLTIRAKSALDRAGVLRARDLSRLPDNRISVIRGLGRATAREIYELRRKLSAGTVKATTPSKPFFPDYRGEDALLIAEGAITPEIATALGDAGLRTLGAVAAAPAEQIDAIAANAAFDVETIRAHLHAESRQAEERDRPTTLEGWCESFVPSKKTKLVRILFGLTPPTPEKKPLPLGAAAEDIHREEVASVAAVYVALSKARKEWAAHPAAGELVAMVRGVAEAAGNAISLEDAARALLSLISHDRARDGGETLRSAAALVRIASEIERDAEPPKVVVARVGRAGLWACTSSSIVDVLRALARAADALAERTPLAAAAEAQAELAAIAAGTRLELAPDRLVAIATDASDKAACSTRLEIYPRGMKAERALDLTAAVFARGTTEAALRARLSERYPAAEPLPARPALDALVAVHGLVWSDADSTYLRPGEVNVVSDGTSFSDPQRQKTAMPSQPLAMTEGAIAAREFDEKLVRAVEQRELRVVFVPANRAAEATQRIASRLGRPVMRLDRLLIDRMDAHRKRLGVPDEAYFKADREGASGKMWDTLVKQVVVRAADDLAGELFPAKQPLILSHLGLLSRYRLERFVKTLADARGDPTCDAIVLVVAAHDQANVAPIEGLTIGGLLPSHRLRAPRAWVDNEHNAAAS